MIYKFLIKRKLFAFILAFFLVFALASCATFNKSSYQALGTMSVAYDTAMKSAADLFNRGLISPEGKAAILEAANSFKRADDAAINAFQAYLAAPPEQQADKKQQFITAASAVTSAYGELLALLAKHGVYGEPVKPWF